jgi:CO/xanthine dehydrogenase Mo-binding subunit
VADGGAYAMSSPGVMNKAAILGPGPYSIPNVWVDSIAVYTNNTPRGAFRSFGAFQSEFATESHLDLCASRLGMDPVQLRLKNLMTDGAQTHTGQQLDQVLATRCVEELIRAAGWSPGVPNRQGQNKPARTDLGQPSGVRASCTLGANLDSPLDAA